MSYNSKITRKVLKKVEYAYDNKWTEEQLMNSLKDLSGTEKEKRLLVENCKIYLFIDQAFNSKKENMNYAIGLARKYIATNRDTSDLIKEKLVTMYIKANQTKNAQKLLSELVEKNPNNERNCSKQTIILMREGKFRQALDYVKEKEKQYPTDPVLFNLHYNILSKLNWKYDILNLLCEVSRIELGDDPIEREYRINKLSIYFRDIRPYNGENKDKAVQELLNKIKIERRRSREMKRNSEKNSKNSSKSDNSNNRKKEDDDDKNLDNTIVREVNNTLAQFRDELTYEGTKEYVERIKNEAIRFIMENQVEFAYGKASRDVISMRVGKYVKDNRSKMTDVERKVIDYNFLRNFLKGRDTLFYIHDKWVAFQKNNFYKLQEEEKKKAKTNEDVSR